MEEFTLTCEMTRRDHFHAQLDILYRAWKHAVVLFAVVFVAFWAVFFADYAKNGTWISWGITGSLLYFAIVVGAMVAVYLIYSPVHAAIKASIAARDEDKLAPYEIEIGRDKITVRTADGAVTHFGWFDLRVYRQTKRFLVLRDRKKKNQTGQLIIPKKDATPGQIEEILRYREDVIRAEEIRKNPVARERARQEKLASEKTGKKQTISPVDDALNAADQADRARVEALTGQPIPDTTARAAGDEAEHGETKD